MSRVKKIAILGSGTGSNARSILEAAKTGSLGGEVVLVVSDIGDAGILRIAEAYGVTNIRVDPGAKGGGRLSDEALHQILELLLQNQIDIIVLAGFMRIVRDPILSEFPGRILNVHPSLLPKYPGLNPVARALANGETETGCTIHLVDRGVDTGEILRQETVPVFSDDTVQELHRRIHEAEHRVYPEVIKERLLLIS